MPLFSINHVVVVVVVAVFLMNGFICPTFKRRKWCVSRSYHRLNSLSWPQSALALTSFTGEGVNGNHECSVCMCVCVCVCI